MKEGTKTGKLAKALMVATLALLCALAIFCAAASAVLSARGDLPHAAESGMSGLLATMTIPFVGFAMVGVTPNEKE